MLGIEVPDRFALPEYPSLNYPGYPGFLHRFYVTIFMEENFNFFFNYSTPTQIHVELEPPNSLLSSNTLPVQKNENLKNI